MRAENDAGAWRQRQIEKGEEVDFIPFRMNMRVGYNQVDNTGHLRVLSTIQFLEEAAIENCYSIDRSVLTLLREGYGWVLRGGSIQFSRYPMYADYVTIETWISKWTTFQGFREFVMFDAGMEACVKATTVWAYIDLKNRRPVPIPEAFKEKWEFDDSRALEANLIKKPLEVPNELMSETFSIRRTDIDGNLHVNNVRYLEWVLETVPLEYYADNELESVEGAFLKEARFEDQIEVRIGKVGETELIHNVIRKCNGEVLATGRSKWKKKRELD